MQHANHSPFSPAAKLFLRIALPILTLVSVAFLISYLQKSQLEPIMAKLAFRPLLEYVLAGITITAVFSWLIDRLSLERS